MRGEILHQFDLSVRERQHFLAIYGNRTDQLALLQHRDNEQRAGSGEICKAYDCLVPFEVRSTRSNIVDVCDLFGSSDIRQTAFRMWANHLSFPRNELRRRIV